MKILPVIKNVEWTNNYQDVPYLTGVNKELWLLKNYLGDSNLTLWDNVKDKKSLVNTDRINATLTVNLLDLKTQIPNLYNTWNIYNLLAVNYFIGNEGQFYFVKKGTGATLVNATTVKFELELDSWMTNIHDKIVNDNKERYVKKGHANRLTKNDTTNKYNLDFNLSNPNWNEITGESGLKQVLGKAFYSPNIDWDYINDTNNQFNGKIDSYKVMNEYNWMIIFKPLTPDTAGNVDYSTGLKIIQKDGTTIILPYDVYATPVFTRKNPDNDATDYNKVWTQNAADPVLRFNPIETLNKLTQESSDVLNTVITKGLFNGFDIFPTQPELSVGVDILNDGGSPKKWYGTFLLTSIDKEDIEIIEADKWGALKIREIVYNDKYKGDYKNLENSMLENLKPYIPSKIFNEEFKNTIPNIFDKEWDKVNLEPTNDKDMELESALYTPNVLSIKINTSSQTKELSYHLLKGKQPTLSVYSSALEGVSQLRKRINEGFYDEQQFLEKENINETIQNQFPIATSVYAEWNRQNQAQYRASLSSAGLGLGLASIFGLGSLKSKSVVGAAAGLGGIVQSALSLNEKKAQITDLKNQPTQVKNAGGNLINLISTDISVQNDYLTVEKLVASDLKYFYDEVYENGVLWDFRYNVRFDSRYWFNFWMILDIHKTLDLTGLNPDEISLVDTIFENGVRLWNIRSIDQELDTNKFDKENLEMEIYESTKK